MFEQSEKAFQRAQESIPGGVNSPARAFKSVGGAPVFFEKARGCILTDVDGNEYIDYVGSWGPMIMGHHFEPVIEAVKKAAETSTSFGAPTLKETEMAELVCRMVPNMDKVRMVNSGTEATMSAVRVARGYTGRDKIIKFKGNYHGHGDSFLIEAGSGALTLGTPSSPGVTKGTAKDTLVARYNDVSSVKELFQEFEGEIAAVVVEPVAGNMGCIPPKEDFLNGLRKLCDTEDTVLIFDEVMCGFRVAPGGAQQRYGVDADITCLGKIVGGGLPVGAYGGKKEIMSVVAPDGPVYQAGTLSGNPLAMSAGFALLNYLHEHHEIYHQLEQQTGKLARELNNLLQQHRVPHHINQVGSMMSIFFTDQKVTDFSSAETTDGELFKTVFHFLLKKGIYLPPSPFESWFLSAEHDDLMINKTLEAFDAALDELQIEAE